MSLTGPDKLRDHFAAHGQEHVFRFWDHLDEAARERLAAQAARVDLELLARVYERARQHDPGRPLELEPAPIERLPDHGGDPHARSRAYELGEEILRAGRAAVVVVAGGQGTRLGFDGPKGAFPIGPVSSRTLFELQAQKLRRARGRYGVAIPWYVMTSPATHDDTVALFEKAGFFELPREDVLLFCQGTVPSLDFDGRLLLASPSRIVESPNGHGGCFSALADSGALDDMRRRGIDVVSYYQVDNPLVRLADPLLLGFHRLRGAEMSCKVVRKRAPGEKMGVVARVNGRVAIVEYTELDDANRHARDASGELVYWAGNLAIHAFDVEFASRIADRVDRLLPYHASAKKIPHVDSEGRQVESSEPNGYKLERFLFDALPAASAVAVLEVRREEEYSPVKNAEGDDSPATARRDLVAQYRRWLAGAGVRLPEGTRVEIDHSRVDSEADARERAAQSFKEIVSQNRELDASELKHLREAADWLRLAPEPRGAPGAGHESGAR